MCCRNCRLFRYTFVYLFLKPTKFKQKKLLQTSTLDPCLDDAIMFSKKLSKLGNKIQLDVADGLPHGFLNLCWVGYKKQQMENFLTCFFLQVNDETRAAMRVSGERISEMFYREEKAKSI